MQSFRSGSIISTAITITMDVNCNLNLLSSVSVQNSNYTYEWRWSLNGLFTNASPGSILGTGNSLTVSEPVLDPCEYYFIQCIVRLNGGIVFSAVISQKDGLCVLTPIPCSPNSREDDISSEIEGKSVGLDIVESLNLNNNCQYVVLNSTGQIVAKFIDLRQLDRSLLPSGVYL